MVIELYLIEAFIDKIDFTFLIERWWSNEFALPVKTVCYNIENRCWINNKTLWWRLIDKINKFSHLVNSKLTG